MLIKNYFMNRFVKKNKLVCMQNIVFHLHTICLSAFLIGQSQKINTQQDEVTYVASPRVISCQEPVLTTGASYSH